MCACGRNKENRGPKQRRLMSAVGEVVFTRRYWKCTCGTDGSYTADELLGVAGKRYTKIMQKHCCRLAAETSFAATSELLHEMLGAALCPETVRTMVEGHGKVMARFQAEDAVSEKAFQEAAGEVECGKHQALPSIWFRIQVVTRRAAGMIKYPVIAAIGQATR